MGGAAILWVVCGWFGWFVSGLDGLWVVLTFTANVRKVSCSLRWFKVEVSHNRNVCVAFTVFTVLCFSIS